MAFVNLLDRLYQLVLAVRADVKAMKTSISAALGADVQMPTTGTWYSGPSVTLGAGTWLVKATISCTRTTTTATAFVGRIWNGSASVASAEASHPSQANAHVCLAPHAVVTIAASTTYTAQATTTAGATTCLIKAATHDRGGGNHATRITAIRISP